jgi:hypothetical protein
MTEYRQPLAIPAGQHPRSGGERCRLEPASRRRGWVATGLLPCALLLFVGCATEAKYRSYVDGFVGQNANQLYATWGAPVRTATTPDGGQVVSFLGNVQSGRGFGVTACETSFILDRSGIVREASYRGEACYRS